MIKREIRTGNCFCNETFDVRCCCWVNDNTFDKCKQKISTTYFRITNEFELYEKISEFGINSIKSYIKKTCRLNDIEWKEIVDIYLQDQEMS